MNLALQLFLVSASIIIMNYFYYEVALKTFFKSPFVISKYTNEIIKQTILIYQTRCLMFNVIFHLIFMPMAGYELYIASSDGIPHHMFISVYALLALVVNYINSSFVIAHRTRKTYLDIDITS